MLVFLIKTEVIDMKITDEFEYGEGYCFGKFISRKNIKKYGLVKGRAVNDKVFLNSYTYAMDDRLTKTKKGKSLTAEKRNFYYGVAIGVNSIPDMWDKNK